MFLVMVIVVIFFSVIAVAVVPYSLDTLRYINIFLHLFFFSESMYVTGRVKAVSFYGFVTFQPILSESEQTSVEWLNHDFYFAFMDKLMLTDSLKAKDIPAEGLVLSVAAVLKGGEITFRAVPSDWPVNFACEQRE